MGEGLVLAVVEDDDEVRAALHRLLRSMGHEVRVFSSAEEFEADPPAVDCLILDVGLPGMCGPELGRRMQRRGAAIPIVFISGDAGPPRERPAPDEGAPSLAKPFDAEQLEAAIARAVSARRHAP